jgi:hypothetical protein
MQCQNCGTLNEDTFRFCMKCGTPLLPDAAGVQSGDTGQASVIPPGQPVTYVSPSQAVLQPSERPASLPEASRAYSSQPHAGVPLAGTYDEAQLSLLNIWGPFAGYGARRRHTGWLMDGQGSRAEDLTRKVESKSRERQIPSTQVRQETLVARGLVVESRPYFVLKRGLVSVALYINQFGRDLFVSLVSYLKPPVSNFRVAVLGLMLLFGAYMTFIYTNALKNELVSYTSGLAGSLSGDLGLFGNTSPASAPSPDALIALLCVIGPMGLLNNLALLLFAIYSVYKFLIEKDLLAGLRVTPNEFNEDDLMALEKAVEQTVRISLDEIGLNADDLKPIASSEGRRLI